TAGLIHTAIGGYRLADIRVVAAFDVDSRKVGKPLEEAVFALPNCTAVFHRELPPSGVTVRMGPVLDGVAGHMGDYPDGQAFRVADEEPCDPVRVLKDSGAEVLVCYLPVGSEDAAHHYAQACLDAGVAMVNCVPVFIASNPEWSGQFRKKNLPIVGDDIKSQFGATIVHRLLTRLMGDRGVKLERTYQLNTGGNTDFLNMLNRSRLASKKVSKTEAVQSVAAERIADENIHIGPSDYVAWQNDNKVCFLRMEGKLFGDVPMNLELRLSVDDSPNSAGCAIDAIRCAKLASRRGQGGVIRSASAYLMKHPPEQFPDTEAYEMLEAFIAGEEDA
ncbi:MAG: inositol-3-phosphate synthase, partial [Myxococcota bacterium]